MTTLFKQEPQDAPLPKWADIELKKKKAVIVGGHTVAALEAVLEAGKKEWIHPIIVGEKSIITKNIEELNASINQVEIIDVPASSNEADIAKISADIAKNEKVDFAIKGHIHSDHYLRGFLSSRAGFRTEKLASHLFVLDCPLFQKPLFLSDGAFNIAPSLEQRLDIARNSIEAMKKFNIDRPKIAILSASETVMDAMTSSVEAKEIADRLNQENQVEAFGPVALDIALSRKAGDIKNYDKDLAGQTDMLLTPSIEVGNAIFKSLVYTAGASAAGVVLGLSLPLVLTSRADSISSRLASLALASKVA